MLIVKKLIAINSIADLHLQSDIYNKDNIREEIAAIPAEMLAKTMENAAKGAQNAINAREISYSKIDVNKFTWNKLND